MRDNNNKDAYWFSHDSNAKDDPKCVLLIDQLGLEGYGIYWVLVEILREQPDFSYPLALIPAIAKRYGTTAPKVESVIRNFGLFGTREDTFFYSPSLIARVLAYKEKQDKKSAASIKANMARWEAERKKKLLPPGFQPDSEQTPNGIRTESESIPIKGKEIKEKENIDNSSSKESELFVGGIPPTLQSPSEIPFNSIRNQWNEMVSASGMRLAKVAGLSEARKSKIAIRWKEMDALEPRAESVMNTVITKVGASKFLGGDNKNGWKCSFDWLFENSKNWMKVYEGTYDDYKPAGKYEDINSEWQ